MNKTILVGIITGLLFGLVAYFSSNNFVVAGIVLTVTILYFLIILKKRFDKINKKINLFHECFHFINNFIVSLNIKGSIPSAYEGTINASSDEIVEINYLIKDSTEMERLNYFKRIFTFDVYQLFVDVIDMWCEEGGNVLEMTSHLVNELREQEEYLLFVESENRRRIIEFTILWILSLTILMVMRFALNDYYLMVSKLTFYPFAIGGFFALILLSIELLTRRISKIEIRGSNNDK